MSLFRPARRQPVARMGSLRPAVSAAAIILENAVNRVGHHSAVFWEDPQGMEDHDELLRKS